MRVFPIFQELRKYKFFDIGTVSSSGANPWVISRFAVRGIEIHPSLVAEVRLLANRLMTVGAGRRLCAFLKKKE